MQCRETAVQVLSWVMLLGGPLSCWVQQMTGRQMRYGRYADPRERCVANTRLVWMVQELPSLLGPLLLLATETVTQAGPGQGLLLGAFCLHYFHRSLIYAWRTRGSPFPLRIAVQSFVFCSINGLLQGHYLLHCAPPTQQDPVRLAAGLCIFCVGLGINVHSDSVLRNLRKPGEVVYKIPQGGLFEWVSAANYLGEVVEWFGFAVASWSLPAAAFCIFSACSLSLRAMQHHRFYQQNFKDYPPSRRALIPFIL